jgi:hypothetical protein
MQALWSAAGAGRGADMISIMPHSECYSGLFEPLGKKNHWKECAVGVGSQLSGHAACIFTGVCNAALGGVATLGGHGLWPAILAGTTVYAVTVLVRFLWSGDRSLPSFKMAALGLMFGVTLSAGIDSVRFSSHHRELATWYQNLSYADRQQIRAQVRVWIQKQSSPQRETLAKAAEVMGYKFPEDFVVLNSCSTSNKELAAVLEDAGTFSSR